MVERRRTNLPKTNTMKKYALLLVAALVMVLSCKKEASTTDCLPVDEVVLDGAVTLKAGNFNFAAGESPGIAKIYLQKNGRYVLGLEQMDIAGNTDFVVYLSPTFSLSHTSLKLFSARTIIGNRYYMLPPNFVIDGFSFVLMQDDHREAAFANAELE